MNSKMFKSMLSKQFRAQGCKIAVHVVFFYFLIFLLAADVNGKENLLYRKKRYLAFPEGASFTVSICTTIGSIGNPSVSFLSYALNWGCAYDLPNETWVIQHEHGFNLKAYMDEKPEVERRMRRNLYDEISTIITSMGYDGMDCIMRALCESGKFFKGRVGTMEEVLVKTIFSLPRQKVFSREDRNTHHKAYPKCGFSLIALAFGKHSENFYGYM